MYFIVQLLMAGAQPCVPGLLGAIGGTAARNLLPTLITGSPLDDRLRPLIERVANGGVPLLSSLADSIPESATEMLANRIAQAGIALVARETGNTIQDLSNVDDVCMETRTIDGLVGGHFLPDDCTLAALPLTLAVNSLGGPVPRIVAERLFCSYYGRVQRGELPGQQITNLPTRANAIRSGDIVLYDDQNDVTGSDNGDLFTGVLTEDQCWNFCLGLCDCAMMTYIEANPLRFDPNTCFLYSGFSRPNLPAPKTPRYPETQRLSRISRQRGGFTRFVRARRASRRFMERIDYFRREGTGQQREQASLPICEWELLPEPRITRDGWFYISGFKSERGDDDFSEAECPSGTVMTGCACRNARRADNVNVCDGARFIHFTNSCRAYHDGRGSGVIADAVCAPADPDSCGNLTGCRGWSAVRGPNDPSTARGRRGFMRDRSRVSCPANMQMTGCTCYSLWSGCRGANMFEENGTFVCEAISKTVGRAGREVQAQARCGPAFEGRWFQRAGPGSDASFTRCREGTRVTSCTCFGDDCVGSSASVPGIFGNEAENERNCRAFSRGRGFQVRARVICGENGAREGLGFNPATTSPEQRGVLNVPTGGGQVVNLNGPRLVSTRGRRLAMLEKVNATIEEIEE